jgi:hypothetical protein
LKPENILLQFDQESGRCLDLKLCDFGLSTKFQPKVPLTDFCGSPGTYFSIHLLRYKLFILYKGFFAPEMIIYGKYYGDKADIWSIGCILLELVLGHEKFCDLWMTAYDYEVMQDKDRFSREILDCVTKLPEELLLPEHQYDFILRLLKLRSSDRPVTKTICVHQWLDGAFDEYSLIPPMLLDPTTPKGGRLSERELSLSPSLSSKSLGSMTPTPVDMSKVMISQRERHMLEVDTVKTGLSLHLPPLEPQTPSVGRAKKFLNNDKLFPSNDSGKESSCDNGSSLFSSPNGNANVTKTASEPGVTLNRSGKDREMVSPRSLVHFDDRSSLIRSASFNGLAESRSRLQSVSEHDSSDQIDDNGHESSVDAGVRRLSSKEVVISPLLARRASEEKSDGSSGSHSSRASDDPLAKQLFDASSAR